MSMYQKRIKKEQPKYTEEVVYSIVSRSLPFFVMVGGWKYKIDDPRWPLSGNTGRKSAVD